MFVKILVWFLHLTSPILDEESLKTANLIEAVTQLPDVDPTLIIPAVLGARRAETAQFPSPLLLAIAWGESRMNSTVITNKCCGVMQSVAHSKADCVRWRDYDASFAAGVAELTEWSHDKRTGANVHKVLLGQACGSSAFNGTCKKTAWPGWVLRRAVKLGYKPVSPLS